MDEKLEAAQVLDDAADYLLVHGVERNGSLGDHGGPRCAVGAMLSAQRVGEYENRPLYLAGEALRSVLPPPPRGEVLNGPIFRWNDATTDDGEVIDTLRHVAKDLRAEVFGG